MIVRATFCKLAISLPLVFLVLAACGSEPKKPELPMSQPFEECVAKLLQPSRLLVQRMKSDGVDLSKPRKVTHLLLGGGEAVTKASKLFAKRGFDILEAAKGRLLLGDDVPLSDAWVSQIVPAMCSKAAEYQLTYDGWDVDMSVDKKSPDKK